MLSKTRYLSCLLILTLFVSSFGHLVAGNSHIADEVNLSTMNHSHSHGELSQAPGHGHDSVASCATDLACILACSVSCAQAITAGMPDGNPLPDSADNFYHSPSIPTPVAETLYRPPILV